MHPTLSNVDHRPWPLESEEWEWQQSWLDLAFVHYRIDVNYLRQFVPRELHIQEYDGSPWIGLVPFTMAGIANRIYPLGKFFRSFPELNLRTYVEFEGRPGVWFISLDAQSWPMVIAGRYVYGLPYFKAAMQQTFSNNWFHFTSKRSGGAARFKARYRPIEPEFVAEKGAFEFWIAERYCFYSWSANRGLSRVDVHHSPWPLQLAELEIEENTMFSAAGVQVVDGAPVCHYSRGVEVVSFPKKSPACDNPVKAFPVSDSDAEFKPAFAR